MAAMLRRVGIGIKAGVGVAGQIQRSEGGERRGGNGNFRWSKALKDSKCGEPGSVHVNPGSGQIREYGEDGLPIKDIDGDHDHGQGVPHVHDWEQDANGRPARMPGRPVDSELDGRLQDVDKD